MVLAGSTGQPMKKSSYAGRIADLREKLRDEGVISINDKGLVFLKDHLFPVVPRPRDASSPGR